MVCGVTVPHLDPARVLLEGEACRYRNAFKHKHLAFARAQLTAGKGTGAAEAWVGKGSGSNQRIRKHFASARQAENANFALVKH